MKTSLEPAIIRYMDPQLGIMQSKMMNLTELTHKKNDKTTQATGEVIVVGLSLYFLLVFFISSKLFERIKSLFATFKVNSNQIVTNC